MKKFFIPALLIAITAISCNKDNSVPEVPEKKVLLARTSTIYTYNGSTAITEYTYDNNGRIVRELEDKGTANEQLVSYTHDSRGNIAAQKFPNRGSLRTEYTYDNQNRMISSQKYASDGSKDEKRTYTYYEDRIEEILTSKAGYNTRRVFNFTADKKNIANFKLYDIKGNLWVDNSYTYTTIKDPKRTVQPLTPYMTSIHLAEKAVSVDYDATTSPTTYTYTYTYVANANNLPSSSRETSNGKLTSTTTFEYVVK